MTSLSESARPAIDQNLSHPKYRPDIDGLRALAVLSVVAFHAFPNLVQGGFVGVDVFFVISGFLISSIIFGSLEKNSFSFVSFYYRRINRIFPALLIVLAFTWALGWFSLLTNEYMQLGKHIAGGSAFISNFVLLGESGYFDNSAETKILLHLWSLGIEEQFYLIWPLMMWIAFKTRINALAIIIMIGGTSFILNVVNIQTDPVTTFYSPQTRFWELLVGSLLAYTTMHKHQLFPAWREASGPVIRNIQSAIGLTCLITAFAYTTKNNQFPGWLALIPTVGAALLIAAGPFAWINRTVLSSRALVWVGLISFPLYLWHWPLLVFARILGRAEPSVEMRMTLVAASFALAWMTYAFIERPLRSRGSLKINATILFGLALSIFSIGFSTYSSNGIDSRFPEEIRKIANFNYDFKIDSRVSTCWLYRDQPFDAFSAECLPITTPNKTESVFIWGDSHAGRLYPGLNNTLGDKYTIAQFNRDSCPPILNYAYKNCIDSNNYVFEKIKLSKPKTVVMFAVWNYYQPNWKVNSDAKTGLIETIRQLKSIGIQNIDVVGPAPHWADPLPALVYKDWENSPWKGLGKISERLPNTSDDHAASSDRELEELLSTQPVRYTSLIKFLCSEKGCLTHVPGKPDELFTWDYGHLTTPAAEFVSRHLIESGAFR